jgi:hypothetical protein
MLSPITTPNNIIIVGIVVYNLFYLPKNSRPATAARAVRVVYNLFYLPKNSDQSSFSFPIILPNSTVYEILCTNMQIIRSKRIIFHLLIKRTFTISAAKVNKIFK